MIRPLACVALVCAAAPAVAAPVPVPRPASNVEVISVYDGDSFRIRRGESSIPVRPFGYDTPEIRQVGNGRPVPECETALALEAREYLRGVLGGGESVIVRGDRLDRNDRLLAHVTVDREPLHEIMINVGHGRPYDGGRRDGWC